ncbi:hypothetical protein J6590_091424 [Homalodisca vitripennis]|nr:hypothetical protein J6590_091424 [Homalodisca vitripennis]
MQIESFASPQVCNGRTHEELRTYLLLYVIRKDSSKHTKAGDTMGRDSGTLGAVKYNKMAGLAKPLPFCWKISPTVFIHCCGISILERRAGRKQLLLFNDTRRPINRSRGAPYALQLKADTRSLRHLVRTGRAIDNLLQHTATLVLNIRQMMLF